MASKMVYFHTTMDELETRKHGKAYVFFDKYDDRYYVPQSLVKVVESWREEQKIKLGCTDVEIVIGIPFWFMAKNNYPYYNFTRTIEYLPNYR